MQVEGEPPNIKLSRPVTRARTVHRDGLLARLAASPEPLVAVLAPAGYGKTSLLGQWAQSDERCFAWLTADARDNDPIVLLANVAETLVRQQCVDPSVIAAGIPLGASILGSAVPRLGSLMASVRRPFVLVVDDIDAIDNQDCFDAIAALCLHVPDGSQLALAARSQPSLPLAHFRAEGRVLVVGRNELSMDEDEAAELFRLEGVDTSHPAAEEVLERAEGWPVALHFAALALKNGRHADAARVDPVGNGGGLAGYLSHEILTRLPAGHVTFMRRTAILDRMSGSLCDAILEQTGSAAVLESLEDANALVVPVGRDREWYRYHSLLRDLLLSELRQREPDLIPMLAIRAEEWHEAHGEPGSAIAYAQLADDVELVARLVTSHALREYQAGRVATMERWFEWLERRDAIEDHPAVAWLAAWSAVMGGRPAEAERWSESVERSSSRELSPEDTRSPPWAALLRALLCRHGAEAMRADAADAVAALAVESPWHTVAAAILGVSLVITGRNDEADGVLAEAARESLRSGAVNAAVVAVSERALLAMRDAAWGEAQALVDDALALARGANVEGYVTTALALALSARCRLYAGDVPGARKDLASAHRLRPRLTYVLPHLSVQTLLELARAHAALSDAAGARTLLREADQIFRHRSDLGNLGEQATALRAQLDTIRREYPGASMLTAAELRLLPYLTTYLTFKQIGGRLDVSANTVKTQAISIYRKLGVTSRSESIDRARELGLLGS